MIVVRLRSVRKGSMGHHPTEVELTVMSAFKGSVCRIKGDLFAEIEYNIPNLLCFYLPENEYYNSPC